jgi:prepilin-type processing-associated H-X9-DG protein
MQVRQAGLLRVLLSNRASLPNDATSSRGSNGRRPCRRRDGRSEQPAARFEKLEGKLANWLFADGHQEAEKNSSSRKVPWLEAPDDVVEMTMERGVATGHAANLAHAVAVSKESNSDTKVRKDPGGARNSTPLLRPRTESRRSSTARAAFRIVAFRESLFLRAFVLRSRRRRRRVRGGVRGICGARRAGARRRSCCRR